MRLESGQTKDGHLKRARFTEGQTIGVVRKHEAWAETEDLARMNVLIASCYLRVAAATNWRHRFQPDQKGGQTEARSP